MRDCGMGQQERNERKAAGRGRAAAARRRRMHNDNERKAAGGRTQACSGVCLRHNAGGVYDACQIDSTLITGDDYLVIAVVIIN